MRNRRFVLGGMAVATALTLGTAATAADQYEYDVRGRLVRVEQADGTVIAYTYDNAGNRTQVVTTAAAPAQGADAASAPAASRSEKAGRAGNPPHG